MVRNGPIHHGQPSSSENYWRILLLEMNLFSASQHMLTLLFVFTTVNNLIDSLAQQIADEIPRHKARWPQSISMESVWTTNVKVMRDFAYQRADASAASLIPNSQFPGSVLSLSAGKILSMERFLLTRWK
jgi:hypothetical protein